jgi:hypothetical protein
VTWVVGFTGFPAGAVVAGDVRITIPLAHGGAKYASTGAQKVHRVARHAVVGFAGSIGPGFEAVEAARKQWAAIPSDHAVSPQEVAERLAGHMRRRWPRFPRRVKRGGLELLVVGCVPEELSWFSEIPGPTNETIRLFDPMSAPARTRSFVFSSPGFDVHEGPTQSPVEIGCGSQVAVWGDELLRSLETSEGLDDREMASGFGAPVIPALWLHEAIRAAMAIETQPTVSEFVQVHSVGPGGIVLAEAEARPRIARTQTDYVKLAKREGFATAEAIAVTRSAVG